jgi:hypothetical protein
MDHSAIGTIRIAAPEDAPGIANMHVASWRETYAGMVPDAMLSSLSGWAQLTSLAVLQNAVATIHDQ